MSPLTVIVVAILLGIVAMSFAFGGGAVIVAVPVALIGVAVIAALDWRKRRTRARSMEELREEAKADKVEFTSRDKETLVSD
ncbi:MAG: hypothetical protein ACM3UV_02520 [Nocardioidaceae bacterium]|jgi:hypothetical protein